MIPLEYVYPYLTMKKAAIFITGMCYYEPKEYLPKFSK